VLQTSRCRQRVAATNLLLLLLYFAVNRSLLLLPLCF